METLVINLATAKMSINSLKECGVANKNEQNIDMQNISITWMYLRDIMQFKHHMLYLYHIFKLQNYTDERD